MDSGEPGPLRPQQAALPERPDGCRVIADQAADPAGQAGRQQANGERALDWLHHALYVACREQGGCDASPTAAIIDSQSVKGAEKGGGLGPTRLRCGEENQRQAATHPRRYARLADASHRARCRHPGPRWRRAADGLAVWLSIPAQTLRRRWLPEAALLGRVGTRLQPGERRDRQALRRCALCRVAETLNRRAHHRLAEPLPAAGQRLGAIGPERPRLPARGINPPHAPTPLPNHKMIPDRLSAHRQGRMFRMILNVFLAIGLSIDAENNHLCMVVGWEKSRWVD